jgi:hypothetical protein
MAPAIEESLCEVLALRFYCGCLMSCCGSKILKCWGEGVKGSWWFTLMYGVPMGKGGS